MRRFYVVATVALASAAAVAAPAFAGGSDLSFTLPIGFSSGGEHKGLETFTHTTTTTTNGAASTTTEKLPGGWDEGKAAWKAPLQSSNPVLTTSPIGHGHH